jgi:hypothetical protein
VAAQLCSDPQGNVFMTQPSTSGSNSKIVEYAHGGSQPIATFTDHFDNAYGCGVDPATEDLAVANNYVNTIVIFPHASGSPKTYSSPIAEPQFCGYDNKSNLFVLGVNGHTLLAELAKGNGSFKPVMYQKHIRRPIGVQWDGKYLALGEGTSVINLGLIRRYTIENFRGIWKGGTQVSTQANSFYIQGSTLLVAWNNVGFFRYPAGGSPYKTLGGQAAGMTVSVAPSGAHVQK